MSAAAPSTVYLSHVQQPDATRPKAPLKPNSKKGSAASTIAASAGAAAAAALNGTPHPKPRANGRSYNPVPYYFPHPRVYLGGTGAQAHAGAANGAGYANGATYAAATQQVHYTGAAPQANDAYAARAGSANGTGGTSAAVYPNRVMYAAATNQQAAPQANAAYAAGAGSNGTAGYANGATSPVLYYNGITYAPVPPHAQTVDLKKASVEQLRAIVKAKLDSLQVVLDELESRGYEMTLGVKETRKQQITLQQTRLS